MTSSIECPVSTVPAISGRVVSSVPGRQRWNVCAVLNRPRYAAAVEQWLAKQQNIIEARVNPSTGGVLLRWDPAHPVSVRALLDESLRAPSLDKEAWATLQASNKPESKARKLVAKLIIGGTKLAFILGNRLVWGAVAVTPLSGTIGVLSIVTTVITGYDFLRALVRTITGQSRITTGTLIGAATVSSVALRENVTALIVLWLLNLGEYLEMITLRRTRRAIRQLLSTDDDDVCLLVNGVEMNVPARAVQVDDVVVVREGRRIPVDGFIENGEATINEASITGESMPVRRYIGDRVFAVTILLAGSLSIRVSEVGADTVVGKLIQRVEEAGALRPRIQTVGDAFAKRVVPSSFAASILVFLVTRDPRRALTMLLVACPCAAGLATPTAVSASVGNGARRGILIKGGAYLETLSEVDTVCFDKTGTLTEGRPAVQQVLSFAPEYKVSDIVRLATRAELHSQHPLALAVLQHAESMGQVVEPGDEFEVIAGRGVRAWRGEDEVLVGNSELFKEFGIVLPVDIQNRSESERSKFESLIYVGHNRQFVGSISVFAAIRPEARPALASLRKLGIKRAIMLTGDSEQVAGAVASSLGLSEWRSKLLPQEKFQAVQALRDSQQKVAMVGDGINDAPALALADVGIAMGTSGSDVAIETADIALAADDLRQVGSVIDISRSTMSVIRQNYGLSLGVSSIGLYLAALGKINPIIAAVLHNLSTLMVVANSARLINYRPLGLEQLPVLESGAHCNDHSDTCGCPDSWTANTQKKQFKKQAA